MRDVKKMLMSLLLKNSGLPSVEDIDEMIKNMGSNVVIQVALRESSPYTGTVKALLEELFGSSREKLELRVDSRRDWPKDYPEPLWTIGGRLGYRFKFYGYPVDLLGQAFRLAVAVAGGVDIESGKDYSGAKGNLLLYVVPGLPCVKAIYYSLPILAAAPEASLTVVNLESIVAQGLKLPPVKSVPTFVTPKGDSIVLTPNSTRDVLRLWLS